MTSDAAEPYYLRDNVLHCASGASVTFEYPIRQVLDYNDVFVVLVRSPIGGAIYNENVFGVSKRGEIVWRVPRFEWVKGNSPYTEMHKSGDLVRLWNYRCTNIFLDPLTGRFIREEMSH